MATKKNLTTIDISGVRNGGGSARYYAGDNNYPLYARNQKKNELIAKDAAGAGYVNKASEIAATDPYTYNKLYAGAEPTKEPTVEPTAEPTVEPTAEPKAPTYNGGGNGGGYGGLYNPSADLAAAYNARQAALQKNFDLGREQLQKAYDDSVNALRTQGEDALRQAYIEMMMSKRGLGQSLEAAGLRGGATESALAGIYNNYANNRNSIARAIEEGLTSAGNVYGNNLANLGMQYNTNSADAMADYQTQLASARQSLANTLAKTSSNSKGTSTDVIAANLKNFVKSPVSARRYLSSLGITGSAADNYLWNAGIDPANTYENTSNPGLNEDYVSILKNFKNDPASAKAYADTVGGLSDDYFWAAGINPNGVSNDIRDAVLGSLTSAGAAARSNNMPDTDLYSLIESRMRDLARQYGLTEAQARQLLAEAGY